MKICVSLILLSILCPGGCPVYNFDLKTVEVPSDFSNDLKLEADLNTQLNQDLLSMHYVPPGSARDQVPQYSGAQTRNAYVGKGFEAKALREANDEDDDAAMENFVGSNLFDGNRKKCFSTEDIALLTARKDFESLIPKEMPQSLLNDDTVSVLMQYFHSGNKAIQHMNDECSKRLTEKAFYDTLGGYLKSYIVPVTKFSFYAGQVNLKTVENVIALYQQCKTFLNTNGNGWKSPVSDLLNELKSVRIEPLKVASSSKSSEEPSCCTHLDLSSMNSDAEDEQMIVSLPKLDAEDSDGCLGNVWLPFKRKHTFNLKSSKSAFIVVKFYETVSHCYSFQKMCQDTYNHKFKEWILEFIQVHLSDEQFYPGLGAVLRIYENLRRGKKAVDLDEAPDEDSVSLEGDGAAAGGEGETGAEAEAETDGDEEGGEDNDELEGEDDEQLKTHEFTEIERTSKKMSAKPNDPFDKIYEKQVHSRGDHKKKCKPKPVKCKPKGKGGKAGKKGKAQKTPKGKKPKHPSSHTSFLDPAKQRLILKYLSYFIALILLILLLILLCGICARLFKKFKGRPKKAKAPPKTPPPKKGTPPKKGSPPPAKKKRAGFYDRFRRKKTGDEEILIKPDSKSVIPTKGTATTSTSTSSLACHPKAKCIPCSSSKKSSRKYDAPVIETTSLDCSSSEGEGKEKKVKKTKPKIVTINEKKGAAPASGATSPIKSLCAKLRRDTSQSECSNDSKNKRASRIGLRRCSLSTDADVKSNSDKDAKGKKGKPKGKSNASSWETMYDT